MKDKLQDFDPEEWEKTQNEFLTSVLLGEVAGQIDMSAIVSNLQAAGLEAADRSQSRTSFPGVSDQINITTPDDYYKYTEFAFMTSIAYKTKLMDNKINVLSWAAALSNLQPIVVDGLHHTLGSNSPSGMG